MEDEVFVRERAYVKQRFLGSGTFGKVYLVKDVEEKDHYALKQINISNHSHAVAIQREFLAMLASLHHRHIIHLFSCGIAKGRSSQVVANFIMEYCSGGTLNDRLSTPSSQVLNLKWTIQISDGVSFLHQRGIIHRDLKAENVLLTTNNNVKLCDLGLASLSKYRVISNSSKSKRREISKPEVEHVGTPCFWSPELLDGAKQSKASDVFALGHILYAIKERCCIDYKSSKLYGAFVKTEQYGCISLGNAQSKRAQPCCLAFIADKSVVDKRIRTITTAALSHRPESRPGSEQVYENLKSTARLLVESKKQNLAIKTQITAPVASQVKI